MKEHKDLQSAVTVLAYHFWGRDGYDDAFSKVEHAFRETWRHCGRLKSVLVVNETAPCVERFAAENDNVEVQFEPSLVPGKIFTMSADMNGKLYSRFGTPYVLIIQNDGYPLRPGLEEFVGKYDFIGAPYVRISWWRDLICRVLGYWMSNGGFSLRSRRICEAAACFWSRYARFHPSDSTVEDLYYTKTLPLRHPSYRFKYKIAPNTAAIRFSYDALVPQPVKELPFGFHRAKTFEVLNELKGQ